MNRRILIVDDEPALTEMVKLMLETGGPYSVREENEATRAVQAAREFRPDLILLDIMMPRIDGGDVAAMLREDPELRAVPVMFLTALVSKDDWQMELPQSDAPYRMMPKPFDQKTLVRNIEEELSRRGSDDDSSSTQRIPPA